MRHFNSAEQWRSANVCTWTKQTTFPVQLYEPFTDSEGNLSSLPVTRDGQPVESREAVQRRDRLIEKFASLPPLHRLAFRRARRASHGDANLTKLKRRLAQPQCHSSLEN